VVVRCFTQAAGSQQADSQAAASLAVQRGAHPASSTSAGLSRALAAGNLLCLLQCRAFCAQVNAQLCAGVRRNKRDALDLAGKLPLAIKASAMGIAPRELNIDPAQAGGLLGKFDAAVCGAPGAAQEGVEIKGARSYRGRRSFNFSRLRPSTPFEHLLFVAREADPQDWTDVRQLDRLFWLGYVPRAALDRAVAAKPGAAGTAELRASMTIGSRRRSWLGGFVTWVPFHQLDRAWWEAHVHGRQPQA
jgi:hypothetical protein